MVVTDLEGMLEDITARLNDVKAGKLDEETKGKTVEKIKRWLSTINAVYSLVGLLSLTCRIIEVGKGVVGGGQTGRNIGADQPAGLPRGTVRDVNWE
jgi:hypothetical protein